MSRKLPQVSVSVLELERVARYIRDHLKALGVSPSLAVNACLYLYAGGVVENDAEVDGAHESLDAMIAFIKGMGPS